MAAKSTRKKKNMRAAATRRLRSGLTRQQHAFITALTELREVVHAAEAVGMNRATHYKWLRNEKETAYHSAFEEALAINDAIQADETKRKLAERGIDGWTETTTVQEQEAEQVLVRTNPDGTHVYETRLVPTKVKQTQAHKFSTTALVWLANHHHGNPSRIDVNHVGEVDLRLSLENYRKLAGVSE